MHPEQHYCTLGKHWQPITNFRPRNSRRPEKLNSWCKNCSHDYVTKKHPEYHERKLKRGREARARLRAEVLSHYGIGGVPMCHCCGEYRIEFLGVDHVEGGGNKHRREIKRQIYAWLKANNFPAGFRDLCHNCNQSLGAYGYCPHQLQHLSASSS